MFEADGTSTMYGALLAGVMPSTLAYFVALMHITTIGKLF